MTTSQPHCADQLKVLANETRLAVMQQLMSGPMHVNQLNRTIRTDQSLLSHHLKILRDAGLVVAERDGKAVLYHVAPHVATQSSQQAIILGCCTLDFS